MRVVPIGGTHAALAREIGAHAALLAVVTRAASFADEDLASVRFTRRRRRRRRIRARVRRDGQGRRENNNDDDRKDAIPAASRSRRLAQSPLLTTDGCMQEHKADNCDKHSAEHRDLPIDLQRPQSINERCPH